MEGSAKALLMPLQRAADWAWARWGLHPHSVARQMYLCATACACGSLLLGALHDRPFVATPALRPWGAVVASCLLVTFAALAHGLACAHGRPLLDRPARLLLSTLAAPSVLLLVVTWGMDAGWVALTQLIGREPASSLLLMALLAGRSPLLALALFLRPLPLHGATRPPGPHASSLMSRACILLIQSGGAMAWTVCGRGGMEAVLFLAAVLADGLAVLLLSLDLPPGNPGRRRRRHVGRHALPSAARA